MSGAATCSMSAVLSAHSAPHRAPPRPAHRPAHSAVCTRSSAGEHSEQQPTNIHITYSSNSVIFISYLLNSVPNLSGKLTSKTNGIVTVDLRYRGPLNNIESWSQVSSAVNEEQIQWLLIISTQVRHRSLLTAAVTECSLSAPPACLRRDRSQRAAAGGEEWPEQVCRGPGAGLWTLRSLGSEQICV